MVGAGGVYVNDFLDAHKMLMGENTVKLNIQLVLRSTCIKCCGDMNEVDI